MKKKFSVFIFFHFHSYWTKLIIIYFFFTFTFFLPIYFMLSHFFPRSKWLPATWRISYCIIVTGLHDSSKYQIFIQLKSLCAICNIQLQLICFYEIENSFFWNLLDKLFIIVVPITILSLRPFGHQMRHMLATKMSFWY